ncbi:MAG: DUF1801 domain-containing protein [Acidobacteria bacterium]|nr:DUF1801 domain-containing protein [Acidobacteriota bacterium]
MSTKPSTPDEYIASLPDDRGEAITQLREAINKNLPKGFKECLPYGMLGWVVPHETYPAGYHCDPSKPLMLMALASNKSGISLHHLGLYANKELTEWFQGEWTKYATRKLDMGKGCIRFKKMDDIPVALIGQLATKLSPAEWVGFYEKALKSRAK